MGDGGGGGIMNLEVNSGNRGFDRMREFGNSS